MSRATAGPDFAEQEQWQSSAHQLPSGLVVADFDGDGDQATRGLSASPKPCTPQLVRAPPPLLRPAALL